jgi:hypothetical protein
MLNFDEQINDDNNSNSSVEPGKFKSIVSLDIVTLKVIFKDYSSSDGSTSRRFRHRHSLTDFLDPPLGVR